MKKILNLSLVVLFQVSTMLLNGQLADTTTYKVKLGKFQTKAHNGKIVTLAGAGAVILGGVGVIIGHQQIQDPDMPDFTIERSWPLVYAGSVLGIAGAIAIIPGSINWSVGNKKVKEYQIRLDDARSGFYFSPGQVGATLAFKI